MPSSYWSTNLKFLRERRGLSQEALATHLGISRSKIAAHEAGNTVNPPVEDLFRFSDYHRMAIDTLLRTDLSSVPVARLAELEGSSEAHLKGRNLRVLALTVDARNADNIELVPVKARAGYAAGYGDPEFIASLPTASLPGLPRGRKYRMFPTAGDSMLPVPEDAFVVGRYCDDWLSLKPGTACIVVTREEGIVFKIATVQGKALRLESLNPAYAPYEVALADVLEVWIFQSFWTNTLPEPGVPADEATRLIQEIRHDVKTLLNRPS